MKRFRKIYIEITNICNMHCSFCPESIRAKATMSLEKFKYVVEQIKEYTDYVYLHVKGEPLLHKNLKQIIDICKDNNLKVNISTNGTLLKEKVSLLTGIRQLNVSLHSFENENEEQLSEYLTCVLDATKLLSEQGVIIRYKLWNEQEGVIKSNNKKILKALEERYKVNIKNKEYNKDIKLDDNTFLSIKKPFKWPDIKDKEKEPGTCYGLRQQIAILVDGTVVPCCVDNNGDIPLGNIFKQDLQQILSSKKAEEIKRGFQNNKCAANLCKKCEYRINM